MEIVTVTLKFVAAPTFSVHAWAAAKLMRLACWVGSGTIGHVEVDSP